MTSPLALGARWWGEAVGESAPTNRQVRTKFATKIDQRTGTAHHLDKIEVQGAHIPAALCDFRAGRAVLRAFGQ